MKKALLFTFAIMMMASCADQMVIDTKTWEAPAQVTEKSKNDDLMAQEKWSRKTVSANMVSGTPH